MITVQYAPKASSGPVYRVGIGNLVAGEKLILTPDEYELVANDPDFKKVKATSDARPLSPPADLPPEDPADQPTGDEPAPDDSAADGGKEKTKP